MTDIVASMKLGYPCINRTLGVSSTKSFRLASFTPERFRDTVAGNLDGLAQILKWNVEQGLLYFRISSDLIPFASHPVCQINWQEEFKDTFGQIGEIIRKNNMRISMHPDQFVILNAQSPEIVNNSISELLYHSQVLDLLGLDTTAKIQIHVGGVYGDKTASMARFVNQANTLPEQIKSRLAIENDDRLYSLKDCLEIHGQTQLPIIFDVFHHGILNNGESISEAISLASSTWSKKDGVLLIDYSSQQPQGRLGNHCQSLNQTDFVAFIAQAKTYDFDLMLEIKDKELSAVKALKIVA